MYALDTKTLNLSRRSLSFALLALEPNMVITNIHMQSTVVLGGGSPTLDIKNWDK